MENNYKKILNLTQHCATSAQVADGVVEPQNKKEVQDLLTFSSCPTQDEITQRVGKLINVVRKQTFHRVMIGGAPYLMPLLEVKLLLLGAEVLYSFSQRKSIEKVLPDGKIEKTACFEHVGFVVATRNHYDGVF